MMGRRNKVAEPGPREWYRDPSLGPENRSTTRFHRLLAAAVIAAAIVETTKRRDDQRVRIAKGEMRFETWQTLESFHWLMGEAAGESFSLAYLCDQLGWNRRMISTRLRQPDRLLGSWSLPDGVVSSLNAHAAVFSEIEQEETDILYRHIGHGTVWSPDPVLQLQRSLRELVLSVVESGRVKELAQFSPAEVEQAGARIMAHGLWDGWRRKWRKQKEAKVQSQNQAALDGRELLRRYTGASAAEIEELRAATMPAEWAEFVEAAAKALGVSLVAEPETCPTPGKASFPTEGAARAALAGAQNGGQSVRYRPKRSYLCPCGLYHLSSKNDRFERGQAEPDLLQAVWIGMLLGFLAGWIFLAWQSGRLL